MLGRRSASALCWVHQKFSRVGKSISAIRVCSGVNNVSFRWVIRIDTSFYESRHPGRWESEEGYQIGHSISQGLLWPLQSFYGRPPETD